MYLGLAIVSNTECFNRVTWMDVGLEPRGLRYQRGVKVRSSGGVNVPKIGCTVSSDTHFISSFRPCTDRWRQLGLKVK